MTASAPTTVATMPEPYRWHVHGINCFTVPKSIATGAFDARFPDRFDAYLYLCAHYDLLRVPHDTSHLLAQPFDMHRLEQIVCGDELGLSLDSERTDGRLAARVRAHVEQGALVLVPINKRACYYWEGYRQVDHANLLLVTGYEAPPVDRFVTFDGEHNVTLLDTPVATDHAWLHDEPRAPSQRTAGTTLRDGWGEAYSRFYATPSMLEQWNRAYDEHYAYLRGSFQILRPTPDMAVHRQRGPAQVLGDIATMVGARADAVDELVAAKFETLRRPEAMTAKERHRYVASQQVLATALARLVARAHGEDRARSLRAACLAAHRRWQHWAFAICVEHRRGTDGSGLPELRREVLDAERTFLRALEEFAA